MALVDTTWYVNFGDGSTTGYYAVSQWTALTTYSAGALIRQLAAPAVGSERVFVCVNAGISGASEPSWTLTRGAKNTDATITWQEASGQAGLNGDVTNTTVWTTVKNTAVTLGQVIKDVAATTYFICTTAGTAGNGSEPSWNTTAGQTTTDSTVTWTSVGAVGNFTGWQAPHTRFVNVVASTWGAVGNQFFVASEHAETQASAMTLTFPGTAASPNFIYCVNKNNVPPTSSNLTTGASISTTGNSFMLVRGYFYCRGVTWNCGSGAVSAQFAATGASSGGTCEQTYENCAIAALGTSSSLAKISFGTSNTNVMSKTTLINTTIQFGNTGDAMLMTNADFSWKKTSSAIQGATLPTTLFSSNVGSAETSNNLLEGVDFSALGSGKTLVGAFPSASRYIFKDCKLGASVIIAATPTSRGLETNIIRSDSGATNYRMERYTYPGTLTTEIVAVRTGGASDGTTVVSHKVVTTANSKWIAPFEGFPIAIWSSVTGSNVVCTLEGMFNGAALPNNDDIWFDYEYLGSASTPLGSFQTGTKSDNLATGSALTASTQAWDSLATTRGNTTAYVVGDIIKLGTNAGRLFFCTTAGTSSGSEPGGYASAVDGGSVTDGSAVFRAGVRFKQAITLSSPQPGMAGLIYAYPKVAKVSSTFYIDPKITLS